MILGPVLGVSWRGFFPGCYLGRGFGAGVFILLAMVGPALCGGGGGLFLLAGTYSPADKPGIYVYAFDQATGGCVEVARVGGIANPSYLAVSADGRFVYVAAENRGGEASVSAFSFDVASGALGFINSQATGGDGPCYVSVDRSGRCVVAANYGGGSVSVFCAGADGSLRPLAQLLSFAGSGVVRGRQEGPHLHSVVFSPDGYLFACDLGADQVYQFALSAGGGGFSRRSSYKLADGSGPRHLVFHPNGRLAYSVGELSGRVSVWGYGDGRLALIQDVAAVEAPGDDQGGADIHLSPDGRFLYVSVRGRVNHLAMFRVDGASGRLVLIGYQPVVAGPRSFVISPNGDYLLVAGQNADCVQVMRVDQVSGLLSDTGRRIMVPKPVCLKFAGE
jgi:6-phosphogluconolactonase (cycloisomerase 2 family)